MNAKDGHSDVHIENQNESLCKLSTSSAGPDLIIHLIYDLPGPCQVFQSSVAYITGKYFAGTLNI